MSRFEWSMLAARSLLWFVGAAYFGTAAADSAAQLVPSGWLFAALWVGVVWLPLWVAPMAAFYVAGLRPLMVAVVEARARRASP